MSEIETEGSGGDGENTNGRCSACGQMGWLDDLGACCAECSDEVERRFQARSGHTEHGACDYCYAVSAEECNRLYQVYRGAPPPLSR